MKKVKKNYTLQDFSDLSHILQSMVFDRNSESFRLLKRWFKLWLQRRLFGWDESETWDLGIVILEFIQPRLEIFIENYEKNIDNPKNLEKLKLASEAIDRELFGISMEDNSEAIRELGNIIAEGDLWW